MLEPNQENLSQKKETDLKSPVYTKPELIVFGSVTEVTNGPNTAPADANGTGGLFGAGGTS